jgi:very-short-patch-repair endonuclease
MSKESRHRKPTTSTDRARKLRTDSTTPERVLWGILRNRRLGGLKFRRQVPFGPYVVDFYCHEHRLVVELDGQSHDGQQESDAARTAYLASIGLRVIRVTNSDLATNPDGVGRMILSQAVGD